MNVVELVTYMKDTKTYHLLCDRCDHQFKQSLPIKISLNTICCPQCLTDGFILGQSRADNKRRRRKKKGKR